MSGGSTGAMGQKPAAKYAAFAARNIYECWSLRGNVRSPIPNGSFCLTVTIKPETRNRSPTPRSRGAGADRHTVSKVVTRLTEKGVYVDNPVSVRPDWFASLITTAHPGVIVTTSWKAD